MSQYGQSLGMSKKPTSYLDVMKQKEEVKPKFNLFDFSSVKTQQPIQTPQINFGQPVIQRNVTNFQQSTISQTQPTKKIGFSLLNKTYADNGQQDIIKSFYDNPNIPNEDKKLISEAIGKGMDRKEAENYLTNQYSKKDLVLGQTQPQDFSAEENLIQNLGERYKQFTTKEDEGFLRTFTKGAIPYDLQKTGALGKAFQDIIGYGIDKSLSPDLKKQIADTIGEDNLKKLDQLGQIWNKSKEGIKQIPGGTEAVDIAENLTATSDLLGTAQLGKGLVTGGVKVFTKGGKQILKGVERITPDLQKKSFDLSTKANRFNAKDIEDFTKITGESPGEFAVKRGMTKVGDDAVEEATKNWQTSMKQADNALEQIQGNFKMQGDTDFIEGAFEGLQNKLSKYSPEIKRVNELSNKYKSEGLTMPEINELKRLYSKNHKYTWVDAGGKSAIESRDIQDGLRNWQFNKAKEMGLSNLDEINKNTQGWRAFADDLAKKLKRSEGNNNISLTDWVALSGGDLTNLALFIGKKGGESAKIKQFLIKSLGKQTKEAIITPDINKPQIKGLLGPGATITPAPKFKSNIKVTPSVIQPNIQKALPPGKVVTPQTIEAGIIQESKIPLKNTKYGTNNNISSDRINTRVETKLKPQATETKKPTILKPKETPLNKSETTKKLQTLTKDNVDDIAKSITTDTTKLAQVKAVIQEHIKKYGEQFKEYMAELVDKIAEKVGAKINLMPTNSKQVSKSMNVSDDLISKAKKYKSADDVADWLEKFDTRVDEDIIKTVRNSGKYVEVEVKAKDLFPLIEQDDWLLKQFKKNPITSNTGKWKDGIISDAPVVIDIKGIADGINRIASKYATNPETPVKAFISTKSRIYKQIYEQANKPKLLKK